MSDYQSSMDFRKVFPLLFRVIWDSHPTGKMYIFESNVTIWHIGDEISGHLLFCSAPLLSPAFGTRCMHSCRLMIASIQFQWHSPRLQNAHEGSIWSLYWILGIQKLPHLYTQHIVHKLIIVLLAYFLLLHCVFRPIFGVKEIS